MYMLTFLNRCRALLSGLSAWDRHKRYISSVQEFYGHRSAAAKEEYYGKQPRVKLAETRTDADVLREQHRFIRDVASDAASLSWEVRLACKYYSKLVKEYTICELSHYETARVGLRWRTEAEVISGKGQFICAQRRCLSQCELATYELPFNYNEAGQSKQVPRDL